MMATPRTRLRPRGRGARAFSPGRRGKRGSAKSRPRPGGYPDQERPCRGRHRRSLDSGQCRHHRRQDRLCRPRAREGQARDRRRRQGGLARLHRHAFPFRIRPVAGRPGPQQGHPGRHHRSDGRASVGRPGAGPGGGRSHDGDAAGQAQLDHPGRLLLLSAEEGHRPQCRFLCRRRPGARLGDGLPEPPAHAGGDGQDQAVDPPGHGGGRLRPVQRHVLCPQHVLQHRPADRIVQGRRRTMAASSPSISATSRPAIRATKA